MNTAQRALPWLVALAALAWIAALPWRPSPKADQPWDAIAALPVSAEGRVKPLDTFARNTLLQISGRQTFDASGRRATATEWLFELVTNPKVADTRPVFRIDHPDLVSLLGFPGSTRTRFSFDEIAAHLKEISEQSDAALGVPARDRDPFQRQIIDLDDHLTAYARAGRLESPLALPPLGPGEQWRPLADVLADTSLAQHQGAQGWLAILVAGAKGDTTARDQAAAAYTALLADKLPTDLHKAALELRFNRAEPFYQASALYVGAFLLACLALLLGAGTAGPWSLSLRRASTWLVLACFLLHTLGIIARIYIQGRPPVTNLYSSAVFIGWVCVPLALTAERFFRLGFGTITASLIGFATLVVAHNLSGGGDSIEVMRAVLDSNFWLSTHVVVVTIGYSATFLAGFLAATYLILGTSTTFLRGEGMHALPRMTYGVICFASITSFVGTVLGGIWADQSWGRFWGWDPKENGAALIVLANVLILHARWGGMVKDRGVATLAVFGNIVTAWSWFGTNMLGVGLHSYGFIESAATWLIAFCLAQLGIMTLGLIPVARWRSLRPAAPAPDPAPGAAAANA